MERIKVDVAIVGAGMVGGALAASLRDSVFSIALIDALESPKLKRALDGASSTEDFEPRVSALTFASRDLLSRFGAWENIPENKKMAYQSMHVWDEQGTAAIDFEAAELYQEQLGYIVENQSIVAAIHKSLDQQEKLIQCYGCTLEKIEILDKDLSDEGLGNKDSDHSFGQHAFGKHVAPRRLYLSDGRVIDCRLLVAADGANSRVRNWMNMATREWDYQHHAIVATIKTELPHQATCWQRFSETGPIAFLPLQDDSVSEKYCSIVWSVVPEKAEQLMSLSNESFCKALTRETESVLGSVLEVSSRYCIPLRQRHAKDYVQPGVALLGDAAHTIHPLAGQGVNLGFKDVAVLSELLLRASKEGLGADNFIYLKRYQRQRQGDNLLMMGAMEGFKRLFSQPDPMVRWLRNTGLNLVNKQRFIKNQLAKHAMGLPLT